MEKKYLNLKRELLEKITSTVSSVKERIATEEDLKKSKKDSEKQKINEVIAIIEKEDILFSDDSERETIIIDDGEEYEVVAEEDLAEGEEEYEVIEEEIEEGEEEYIEVIEGEDGEEYEVIEGEEG